MTEYDAITRILDRYTDDSKITKSQAFPDGGSQPPFARLERAAMNQATDGEATCSRYGIWANTVRDSVIEAIQLLEDNRHDDALALLRRSANALSAFSDIQALLDPSRDQE